MMFRLDNKTAIITGGGSGIGRAISILLAKQGAKVYILDMDETGSQSVVKEISEGGFSASFIRTDVSNQEQVNGVFSQVLQETGRLDLLVNNAGIAHIGNAENTREEDFERLFRVNVKGVYNCLHAAVLQMKEKGGAIINMASVAGLVGIPDRFAYSMTKGAVMGMTLSVAKDYLKYNIRCNSISPARVHTPFVDNFISKNYPGQEKEMFAKLSATQPIGRMGTPDEIAHLALYLCSDEASFITGCDYPIDGGFVRLNN
jgi:2-keto-3-deoxy-L-fuconate dehydrogenase